ncbi:MAG TPA: alkaline phosphatase family protein [Rhizomicrobium sp.]|nr:alkaline phosphatase family protein [Rhizomicrobium sp.]
MTQTITNVFVVMLENHSFDNIFAMSGIPGIRAATTADSNTYDGKTYRVKDGAPPAMTTDPGHEFEDVIEQLCGKDAACKYLNGKGGAYPAIDRSGFAHNYATSTSEDTGRPAAGHIGDIMACFHTPTQLPVIHQLATEFAICDAWHSSLPGPTWPNRFFVHGASSAGMTVSPGLWNEVEWESFDGFKYANGSIYDRLNATGHKWRLYIDCDNAFSDDPSGPEYGGWISQAASLKNIHLWDVHRLAKFQADVNAPAYRDVRYTFIEPNFGKSFFAKQGAAPGPTYKGGSAQHPEDDPSGGEGLLKFVYETIRNAPLWDTSLLIITYDEHGGFYDHVVPCAAPAPGGKDPDNGKDLNPYNFDFQTYGVRVPAVIVSPFVPKGTVDHTRYDHASALATVERILGIGPLTARDADANDVRHLLSLPAPRTDCPATLVAPLKYPPVPSPAENSDAPLPSCGNAIGFLQVLLKAELALADDAAARAAIAAAFLSLKTHADARGYVARLYAMIEEKRAALSSR